MPKGHSALAEYFLGTSEADPNSGPDQAATIAADSAGQVMLTLRHPLAADQAEVFWETSIDLETWEPTDRWPAPTSSLSGGTETLYWQPNSPENSSRFYRLRFRLR